VTIPKPSNWLAAVLVAAVTLIIVAGAVLAIPSNEPFIQMGSIITFAVALMIFLLFVIASGFTALGLGDPKEALGLPPGSVRALIALLLLLMFIFFTIYLFGQVAVTRVQTLTGLTTDQVSALGNSVFAKFSTGNTFTALVLIPVSEAADRFAQQIFTAALTLVTAVSSFYFAKSTEGAGAMADRLGITTVTPAQGRVGAKVPITLSGGGFVAGTTVRLRKAAADIVGSNVQVRTSSLLECTFDLTSAQTGQWDVVVRNGSEETSRLQAFEVVP